MGGLPWGFSVKAFRLWKWNGLKRTGILAFDEKVGT